MSNKAFSRGIEARITESLSRFLYLDLTNVDPSDTKYLEKCERACSKCEASSKKGLHHPQYGVGRCMGISAKLGLTGARYHFSDESGLTPEQWVAFFKEDKIKCNPQEVKVSSKLQK